MKKINFDAKCILTQLSHVAAVVGQKNSMPILDCIKLETFYDESQNVVLKMTASDAETWISEKAFVNGDIGINVCVGADDFLKGLRNLSDTNVELEIDDESHTITCNYANGFFKLTIDNADDFPTCKNDIDESATYQLEASKLFANISSVLFATTDDALRPALNCVHVDLLANGGMVFVATDGQKLAKIKDSSLNCGNVEDMAFNLPNKPTNLLLNILNSQDENVSFKFNDCAIVFFNDIFTIETRLQETRYPNYNSVIPNEFVAKATFNRQELIDAIKRVAPMGNTTSELMKLDFSIGKIIATAENIDFCKKGQETINCEYNGENMGIGFKSSFLLQSAQNINCERIDMHIINNTRAVVLSPNESSSNCEYTYLLMPLLLD